MKGNQESHSKEPEPEPGQEPVSEPESELFQAIKGARVEPLFSMSNREPRAKPLKDSLALHHWI